MKKYILTLILLIGIYLIAYPQSYLTINNKEVVCWTFKEASVIVNAGIKSIELEERNSILYNINDSLKLALDLSNSRYSILLDNYNISQSKSIEYENIISNKNKEISLYAKEAERQKTHKWIAIIGGIVVASLVIVK